MVRVSIGFDGGQVLATKLEQQAVDALRKALQKDADGWHELAGEDGTVLLDLDEVVYLRTELDEPRVGFGA